MPDQRQAMYDGFLERARADIKDDPSLKSHPGYWMAVGEKIASEGHEDIGAVRGIKVLVQLAYSDACKEAGLLSEVAVFSAYHADAPKPPR